MKNNEIFHVSCRPSFKFGDGFFILFLVAFAILLNYLEWNFARLFIELIISIYSINVYRKYRRDRKKVAIVKNQIITFLNDKNAVNGNSMKLDKECKVVQKKGFIIISNGQKKIIFYKTHWEGLLEIVLLKCGFKEPEKAKKTLHLSDSDGILYLFKLLIEKLFT